MPTLANVSIKDSSSWTTMLNMIYPVGSYYLSTKSTSPANIFGGSWSALTGRFLYCNNSTVTGGNNNAIVVSHNHSATSGSAGAHTHSLNLGSLGADRTGWEIASGEGDKLWYGQVKGVRSIWQWIGSTTQSAGAHTHTITVSSKGSSGTNANMPQYQACYCWYRTA